MRIAELSRRSGVPIPTIKYYMREGLLPPGERTSPNQAQYEETHLRRLKLARALVEVGGLSIAAARDVLTLMDSQMNSLSALGKAQYALTTRRDHVEDEAWAEASRQVEELIAKREWRVGPRNPARLSLTEALATMHRLRQDDYFALLGEYAETVGHLAELEITAIMGRPDLDSMAEAVVIWTAIGDAVVSSLRRIAQEAETARRFGGYVDD
ncbi:MerR family transcriptional regulator [Streptosporangium sp. NPDC001559]|uniref:MerR family transcriptional regulator n=1 Tax=Streptosporangium jomthongense TaxID=1193683 RepID=A0ABV8ER84_9ACTN